MRVAEPNLADRPPPWLDNIVKSPELRRWLDEPFNSPCVADALESIFTTLLTATVPATSISEPQSPIGAGLRAALASLPDSITRGAPVGTLVVMRKAAFEATYHAIVQDPAAWQSSSSTEVRRFQQTAARAVARVGMRIGASNPMLLCEVGLSEAIGKMAEEYTKSLIDELSQYTIGARQASLQ